MAEQGFEKEKTVGLEWIDGNIEKINYLSKDSLGRNLKIPHMGWNNLNIYNKKHPVLENISNDEQFYFVHSYYLNTLKKDQILADTYYSHKIPAIVGQKNYLGVQFHPEKSNKSGHKLITNWLKWKP
jgi:glutamine amidotransferase